MKRKHNYLIVSQYTTINNTVVFYEDFVTVDYKLNTVENINKIREDIRRKHDLNILVTLNILNIMLLKK